MPFRPHWWVDIFLRKKNIDAGFENFRIFSAKKRPFSNFWTPLFSGRRPGKKIGILLFFLPPEKISRFGAPPYFDGPAIYLILEM